MTPMRSGFSTDSEAVTDSVWRCDRCGPGGLSLMSGNSRLAGLKPTHPGELLREDVFPALGIPKTQIAKRLGISRAMLYAILEERAPITPAMALRIGKLLGTSPESWLNMQRDYDLRMLEPAMSAELSEIETIAA